MSSNNASAMLQSSSIDLTNNTKVITLDTLKKFLETRQMEGKNDSELKIIIEVRNYLFTNYVGFVRK